MNQHRLFIAVNLPERIKNRLDYYQNAWPDLPAKWTKPMNLHITLLFLGNIVEKDIPAVLDTVECVSKKYPPAKLEFEKITYGPPKKIPPRMVWITLKKSDILAKMKEEIEQLLIAQNIRFQIEDREFSPHITFARLKSFALRQMDPEEVPQIEEEINLNFEVKAIDLMESRMKKFGPEYDVLESCELKGEELEIEN